MASNYGVVAFISPPRLVSVTQPQLIKFETDYAAYKEKCADVNRTRAEAEKIPIAPIRDCMESSTLQALCMMGDIAGATTVEDATREMVQAWFDSALAEAPRDLSERIRSALSTVQYKLCKDDPAGEVVMFVIDVIKSLDQNNASEILNDMDKAKFLIDRMEGKLEPPLLRKRVRMKRTLWSKTEKGDIKLFRREASALAVDVAQNEVARSRLGLSGKRSRGERIERDETTARNVRPKRSDSVWKNSGAHKSASGGPGLVSNNTSFAKDVKCLNPNCNGNHLVKECPKTTPEKRQKLLDNYFKAKKAMKTFAVAVQDSDKDNGGRYIVIIEDHVRAVALGDSGADCSAISNGLYEELVKAVPSCAATVKHFDKPLPLEGAFGLGLQCTASKSIVASITLFLPGSNIPVRLRGVHFVVVNDDMNEVLLGRPFLNAIGFNLDEHLEIVRPHGHDKHTGDIDPEDVKLRKAQYSGMSYQSIDGDPIELPEGIAAGIGNDSDESIRVAFRSIVKNARKQGISDSGADQLLSILNGYRDVFRIKLGPDPPANVPPLTITPIPSTRPYRSPQRRYAPQQRDFIIQTIRELESVGAIYKNPSARRASPALAVPKPGSKKLRFTVHLRGPNAITIPIQSAMQHLESKLQDISGSGCFANIDLAHGDWQVPLSNESQEFMSIQTPIGVYSSRRSLQGGNDSGNHFQAVLPEKFEGRVAKMLQWLEDFLFYAASESELLQNLKNFLHVCREVGLKVHAEKSNLFAGQVNFCGRTISKDGVRYSPRNLDSLLQMKKPSNAAELQQLLCATNWMRTSIPAYSEVVAPLHYLMEDAYKKVGKRTKQAVRRVPITSSWGAVHDVSFETIKSQLADSVTLAYPKPDHSLCLFTDASDTHWASILTQVPNSQRRREIEDQDHSPLCFLSGAFRGPSMNWSVPEKEGFAIVESMCRLDYLVLGHEVSIFTDHANLVYLYDPYGRNPSIGRHTASKLTRWAIKLSGFRYVIEHLPGDRNVWADMLTLWAVKPSRGLIARTVRSLKTLMLAPITPGLDSKLDWPHLTDIMKCQDCAKADPPSAFKKAEGGIMDNRGVLWIPEENRMMKLRLMIAAHCKRAGHRSWSVTHTTRRGHFFWKGMTADVEALVRSCIHCLCTATGAVVPRPLGKALHADRPNQLLHFDFCYMSKGEDDYCYVLILKDDHSGYVCLCKSKETTAEVVAEALTD